MVEIAKTHIQEKYKERFDVVMPAFLSFVFIWSFLFANHKVNFFSDMSQNELIVFLKWFLKSANPSLLFMVLLRWTSEFPFSLLKRRKRETLFLFVFTWLIITCIKTFDFVWLWAVFVLVVLILVLPERISPFMVAGAMSFLMGVLSGKWAWFQDELKIFIQTPFIFLVFNSAKKHKVLSIIFASFTISVVIRGIGFLGGLTALFFKSVEIAFGETKKVEILSALVVSPFLFFCGYFYFLEFQKGIPFQEPYAFLSKIHLPFVISSAYIIIYVAGMWLFPKLKRDQIKFLKLKIQDKKRKK